MCIVWDSNCPQLIFSNHTHSSFWSSSSTTQAYLLFSYQSVTAQHIYTMICKFGLLTYHSPLLGQALFKQTDARNHTKFNMDVSERCLTEYVYVQICVFQHTTQQWSHFTLIHHKIPDIMTTRYILSLNAPCHPGSNNGLPWHSRHCPGSKTSPPQGRSLLSPDIRFLCVFCSSNMRQQLHTLWLLSHDTHPP